MSKLFKFKQMVSISAAAVCLLSSLKVAQIADFDTNAAELTAFEITQDMKIGWNYGNSLDATASTWNNETKTSSLAEHAGLETETAWGNPKATQEMIDAVKAKGFNTVRLPTTWFQHLDSDNNIDPEWLARVHEVVDYCYKDNMYVILNVHHENWINRSDLGSAYDEMHTKLMKIWSQIAEEFKDYDQHLIFECMNEPRAVDTDHEWWGPTQDEVDTINKLNADFVNLIRSTDSAYSKNRLLMIPGYCASSDITMMSKVEVPDDDFVAVSVHAYSPYGFTMDSSVADHSTFTEKYANELQTILDGVRSTFTDKDIPVVIGEFSASNYDNTEARCDWATKYISTAKAYGIPCVLWDNDARGNSDKSERHDYLNRKTLEWYEDSGAVIDTMMKVLDDSSIVWGSERKVPTIKHEDISTGKQILDSSASLDASVENGNCTPGLNATWADLENNEVAVKYTGDTPIVAVCDGNWKGWTEIKPYDIDTENGIAYYSSSAIKAAWSGDPSEIEHLFARTDGKTTISNIAIIGASEIVEPPTEEDKTIKYDLDFTKSTSREDTLVLDFTGTAGSYANGCVGFMNGADWQSLEWEGTFNDNGLLEVKFPMTDIPADVKAGQAQVWWSDKDIEGFQYYFASDSVLETTTVPVTTTTTSQETTTVAQETTTSAVTEDIVYGDANGDGKVTLADCVAVLQFITNSTKYPLTETQKASADVDGVGGITGSDALVIQQYDSGKIASLPVKA